MGDCFNCKQKQIWLNEKLNVARIEAQQQAIALNETMAIVKQGANYLIIKAADLTVSGVEFFSKFG